MVDHVVLHVSGAIATDPRRDRRDHAGDYEPVLGMHYVVYTVDLKADSEELVHKKLGASALRSGATVRAHKQTPVLSHEALEQPLVMVPPARARRRPLAAVCN
jgi:hypothetical protein